MNYEQFKKVNTAAGWVFFLFALAVYTLTMESSASLWDCGEFIASAYKMQVVHPPGAPMFLMIARMFSLLSFGDPASVSIALNFMSALCSAFSMLFLFWITTHLARRMLFGDAHEFPMDKVMAILGAGAIAAMSGTFVDSIWFSAVEAEVYAMSLTFTAMVFWAMLKWEERAQEPFADKWLLFIAFLVGCSIFVHWLNLLCIPAMAFIYYFRRYQPTPKGAVIAFLVAIAIVGFILNGVITGVIEIAAGFELFFVNSLGLPFSSGVAVFFILFVGAMVGGLWYTYQKNIPVAHNAILAFMFIMIGYSSIVTAVIRSNADPNIDMNNPENIVALASYLKREQYGSRPFLFGHYYTDKVIDVKKVGTKYKKGEKKYEKAGDKIDYVFSGKQMFFPRVWSKDHVSHYERWLGKKGRPNYGDNIKFFLNYQIGHMYVRYFMWNFVGRQNDEQGMGDIKNGNWLSGIPFLDSMRLGNQSQLPDTVKNHDARNTFFFLPLLLGLLGLIFHFTNDRRHAIVILLLFVFTGVAIIIQGNSPPIEPRERDYIFAGSFYAFTIWIGLGVVALYDLLKNAMKGGGNTPAIAAIGVSLIVPLIMGFQGWDDHNRSGRTAARDFATNYLESCAPNAILFTQGDNDTYPLWYAQEVEGIRRDVRIVNLSLLGVDWYINQLRRKVNDAAPVKMTLGPDKIKGTKRDVVAIYPNEQIAPKDKYISIKEVMKFVGDDSRQSKLSAGTRPTDYVPTQKIKIPVDLNKVKAQGAIAASDANLVVPDIQWDLPAGKSSFYKNDLMVMDIIAANEWERPIYFAVSVSPGSFLGLQKYFQLEGLAYRLVPIPVTDSGPYTGRPNTDIMYKNVMEKFSFGNVHKEGVHVDTDVRRMLQNFRSNYARLADALVKKGQMDKAVAVLDKSQEMIPDKAVPYGIYMYQSIQAYYKAKAYDKANALADQVVDRLVDELRYFNSLSKRNQRVYKRDKEANEQFIALFIQTAKQEGQTEFAKQWEEKVTTGL